MKEQNMRKVIMTVAGIALLGMGSSFAKENEIGINMGATSIYNKDSVDFSSFSAGVNYQFNNTNDMGIKPRVDIDYIDIQGYSKVNALYKGSINAVYEFAEDNTVSPYVLAGVGYEYVDGELNNEFEDHVFSQVGAGLTYQTESGVNLKVESKVLQIYDGVRQENEIMVLGGVSIPVDKFKRKKVIENDCPIKIEGPDEDRDGVLDSIDQCPNTPCGFTVDAYGCPIKGTLMILFEVDKAIIRPESMPKVQKFAQYLMGNKGTTVKIIGHTDSDASDAYNMVLSEKRANSVMRELVGFGVSEYRLTSLGKGESMPVASNNTAEGKALNRRIEVELTYPELPPVVTK